MPAKRDLQTWQESDFPPEWICPQIVQVSLNRDIRIYRILFWPDIRLVGYLAGQIFLWPVTRMYQILDWPDIRLAGY